MATGAYFSYRNSADFATLAAYNSQTYSASLPLANLKDHRLSKIARTTGSTTNGFSVSADFTPINASGVPIKVVALCGLNFDRTLAQQETNFMSWIINFSNVSLGAFELGQIIGSSVADSWPYGMPPGIFVVANGNAGYPFCKYVSITANWTRLVGSPSLDCGRLWIGDAIVLPGAIEEGWSQTIQDLSSIQRSRGGQIYSDIRQRYRNTKLEVKNVPRTQIFPAANAFNANFQEMFLNIGVGSEAIVIPRSALNTGVTNDDAVFMNHTSVYGVLSQKPSIVNTSGDNYNISMEFDESL